MKLETLIAIDLETTGLQPDYHEIIELCMIQLNDNYTLSDNKLHMILKIEYPERFSKEAQAINKISLENNSQNISQLHARDMILNWLDNIKPNGKFRPLGQNYENFDIFFLRNLLNQSFVNYSLYDKLFDTPYDLRNIAKEYDYLIEKHNLRYTPINKYNLNRISKYCGIINEDAHTAFSDVKTTVNCYKKLKDFIDTLECRSDS